MTGPEPHIDSGEIRETANPEDIPPDETENPDEKEAANGEESEPEGTQTTGSFGQTYSS